MTWRKDMENAPRDGTPVIIYDPGLCRKVLEAFMDWDPVERDYYWSDLTGDVFHPTAWQLLPEPPTDERVEP